MGRLTFTLCLLLATTLLASAEQKSFRGFQLVFVYSRNLDDVKFLGQLRDDYVNIDFWREATPGHNATVMVPPTLLNIFKNKLDQQGISYVIMVNDVQKMVDAGSVRTPDEEVTKRCLESGTIGDHTNYHTYEQIVSFLEVLQSAYPRLINVSHLKHQTHEGRAVHTVKLSGAARSRKKAIIIEAGMHAREWISPATVLWVIEKNRMWRKNKRYISSRCTGVDLNRNFKARWGTTGISTNCASDIYPGTGPFSEPETANIRDLFNGIRYKVLAYLSVHAYSQLLLVPWGYTKYLSLPPNAAELNRVAYKMWKALKGKHGSHYEFGTAWEVLNYAAAGTSKDWALRRSRNIYSMSFELRPTEDNPVGFLLPPSEIVPTAEEFYESLRAMAPELK
ncbi:carboxypeptidase B-like [Physella acuta]|uniref:carboxypeptidase B-like n=1 Tax=Physella acuta TaxID=109671 RepID=UPI0027DCFB8D|nr:carboxypeptidase B-like [Physella acuta]